MLSIENHSRDSAGLLYVYPVVSRRAGGVSVGVNLNPNNACNWACAYCQVEDLRRGGPPPIDLQRLEQELVFFLDDVLNGDFMLRQVPAEARRLVDVAFSGNGEPTSAPEFADAIDCIGRVLERFGLLGKLVVRVISNGSLMHRPVVQEGLRRLAVLGGEVWYKLDRGLSHEISEVNGVPQSPEKAAKNLQICCGLVRTWVQTCWFAIDGIAPTLASEAAYCAQIKPLAASLAGVHLYGLARPSLQPAAGRLSRLGAAELNAFAARVEKETGLTVMVSP